MEEKAAGHGRVWYFMETLRFELSRRYGLFKPLNATNGGPWHKRGAVQMKRDNFAAYRAARIPYSRNHDSELVTTYGGPYSHDITRIFPHFDADPEDPCAYDFACTDEDISVCIDNWQVIEEFCRYMGGREDIWYAANIEIIDYMEAVKNLKFSADNEMVYNPGAVSVWLQINDKQIVEVKGGALTDLTD